MRSATNHEKNQSVNVRVVRRDDVTFVRKELTRNWSSPRIWSIGRMYQADELPGFLAELDSKPVGLATYCILPGGYQCELVTISSLVEKRGVGSALLEAVVDAARRAGCQRIFLTTTNDNMNALRFYQKRSWRLCALHTGIVERARRLYPDKISLLGSDGIPIYDEIELEFVLYGPA